MKKDEIRDDVKKFRHDCYDTYPLGLELQLQFTVTVTRLGRISFALTSYFSFFSRTVYRTGIGRREGSLIIRKERLPFYEFMNTYNI